MQLTCTHDPADPNHMICEAKRSHIRAWFKKRWADFYCVSTSCPPHRASLHLAVDIFLVLVILTLVISIIFLSLSNRGIQTWSFLFNQRSAEVGVGQDKVGGVDKVPKESGVPAIIEAGDEIPQLDAEAIYFSKEGEQLGRGPWPPKAGEATELRVFLRVGKILGGGTPSVVVVRGILAPGVEWTGFAPMGKGLSYEPETRVLRFNVGDESVAVFGVKITPTAEQIATGELLIINDLRLTQTSANGQRRVIQVPDVITVF